MQRQLKAICDPLETLIGINGQMSEIKFSINCYFEFSDIVINNAGILRDKSFARISDLDWGEFL